MSAVTGTSAQSATAGTAVATPPAVHVVDVGGASVPGVTVTFSVTSGGGSVAGGSAITNANGIASVTNWTLGTTAGANVLTAQVKNLTPVTFSATGLPGVATQLAKSSADPQTGVAGAIATAAPSVTAKDVNGNGVPGVAVTFAVTGGGGAVSAASVTTAQNGVATVGSWTYGTKTGTNSLTASAPSLPTATFTATTVAGPAALLNATPAWPTLAPGSTQQLDVVVTDQYANVVAGSTIAYITGNPSIATVSTSGLISAVAPGSTTISVSAGSVTKVLSIVVGAHPAGTSRVDVPEGGRPFAVRASVQGVVYVGEQDNGQLGRYSLPSTVPQSPVHVGIVPTDVAFSPDGAHAYATNQFGQSLSVIDVATNVELTQVPLSGNPFRVLPSRDGAKIFVTNARGVLFTVDAATAAVSSVQLSSGPLNGIALHPTQPVLYVSSTAGDVHEVSSTTGQELRAFNVGGAAQEVVVSPDGTQLFIAVENGALQVRSTSSLALIASVPAVMGAFGAAMSPDGAQLYATTPVGSQIVVLDRASLTVTKTYAAQVPRRVTFDRSGTTAIVGDENLGVIFIK